MFTALLEVTLALLVARIAVEFQTPVDAISGALQRLPILCTLERSLSLLVGVCASKGLFVQCKDDLSYSLLVNVLLSIWLLQATRSTSTFSRCLL